MNTIYLRTTANYAMNAPSAIRLFSQIIMAIAVMTCLPTISLAKTATESTLEGWEKREAGDPKGSLASFSHAIKKDSKYAEAYYGRARLLMSLQKYDEAMTDLNRTVELKNSLEDVLVLRGRLRNALGDHDGGCEDLKKAVLLKQPNADAQYKELCVLDDVQNEGFMIDWPDSEGWKVGSSQAKGNFKIIELVRGKETMNNWTEMGTIMTIVDQGKLSPTQYMNLTIDGLKKSSPGAKLQIIESNDKADYPYVLFVVQGGEEVVSSKDSNRIQRGPESQVWYVVRGKKTLYITFRAYRKSSLSSETVKKWVRFLKTGKVVSKK